MRAYDSEGTAVYLFCLVPNNNHALSFQSNFDVQLNGDTVYTYSHTSDGTTSLDDALIYSNASLSARNIIHNLTLVGTSNANNSVILFDYIIYTWVVVIFPLANLLIVYPQHRSRSEEDLQHQRDNRWRAWGRRVHHPRGPCISILPAVAQQERDGRDHGSRRSRPICTPALLLAARRPCACV